MNGFEPFLGGPEAGVFLVEGGAGAVGEVAGRFGVAVVGPLLVVLGYAGFWWGLEEEEEEGDCGDGD